MTKTKEIQAIDIKRAAGSLAEMVADWYGDAPLPNARITAEAIAQRLARFAEGAADFETALTAARAEAIYSSQLMLKFRDTLSNIVDGCDDEGDRVYFGSTNAADQLREIAEEIEDLEWSRILASSQKKPDLYATIRTLRTGLGRANNLIAAIMTNDPGEPVSDAGHVALDAWKSEAEALRELERT